MSGDPSDLAATVAHKTYVEVELGDFCFWPYFGLIDDAEMLETSPKIRTSHTKLGYQTRESSIILVNQPGIACLVFNLD